MLLSFVFPNRLDAVDGATLVVHSLETLEVLDSTTLTGQAGELQATDSFIVVVRSLPHASKNVIELFLLQLTRHLVPELLFRALPIQPNFTSSPLQPSLLVRLPSTPSQSTQTRTVQPSTSPLGSSPTPPPSRPPRTCRPSYDSEKTQENLLESPGGENRLSLLRR